MWCGDPGLINIIYCDTSSGQLLQKWEASDLTWKEVIGASGFPLSSVYLISALLVLENSVIGLTRLVSSTNSYQMNMQDFVLGMFWKGAGEVGEEHHGQR